MKDSLIVVDSHNDISSTTEVGVCYPAEAFEQKSSAASVSHVHVITDGDRDEEAFTLSPTAGASSEAPASSGIPSAMTQHHQWSERTT